MVHWDATHLVQIYSPVFNSFVSVTQGLIRSGISVAFSRDVSIEDGYLFVGYFTLMGLQDIVAGSAPVILSVLANPYVDDTPTVFDCTDMYNLHEVQGAQFVFPYEARIIGVESKSWGAIKALY